MYILHLLVLYLSMKWNDNPMHSGQGAFDEYGYLMKTALSTLILHQMNSWRCLFTKWHMWVGGSVFRKHTMLGKYSTNEKMDIQGTWVYSNMCNSLASASINVLMSLSIQKKSMNIGINAEHYIAQHYIYIGINPESKFVSLWDWDFDLSTSDKNPGVNSVKLLTPRIRLSCCRCSCVTEKSSVL